MQLFLDSADESQVEFWLDHGVLDGVTTNPTVLRRDGVHDRWRTLAALAARIDPFPLHVEVVEDAGDALIADAKRLAALGANIVVKVPVLTPDGQPLLHEIHRLSEAGVAVNATACLSLTQAVLASKAGARYVSVLLARVDDEGGDGAAVVDAVRAWIDEWRVDTRVIAASLRAPRDVTRAIVSRAHCITVPPALLSKSMDHQYTRATVRQFLDDARS